MDHNKVASGAIGKAPVVQLRLESGLQRRGYIAIRDDIRSLHSESIDLLSRRLRRPLVGNFDPHSRRIRGRHLGDLSGRFVREIDVTRRKSASAKQHDRCTETRNESHYKQRNSNSAHSSVPIHHWLLSAVRGSCRWRESPSPVITARLPCRSLQSSA